jgi:hypothetical protein
MQREFEIDAEVAKVDESLGLVFGFAIVSKDQGVPYVDVQDDHIPEQAMLKAALRFVEHNNSVAKEMHRGDQIGTVPFVFPMTSDIAKSLDIDTDQTGLLIGMKPSREVLGKFAKGEYTGFSIGGVRIKDQEV